MLITICSFVLLISVIKALSPVLKYDFSSASWTTDLAGKLTTPLTSTSVTIKDNTAYLPTGASLSTLQNFNWDDSIEMTYISVIYITNPTGDIYVLNLLPHDYPGIRISNSVLYYQFPCYLAGHNGGDFNWYPTGITIPSNKWVAVYWSHRNAAVIVIPKYFTLGYVNIAMQTKYDTSSNYPAKLSYYKPDSTTRKYFGYSLGGSAEFYIRRISIYDSQLSGSDVISEVSSCNALCVKCIGILNSDCISCTPTYFFKNNSINYGKCGCHPLCNTCSGPLQTSCLTCNYSMPFINATDPACVCQQGNYYNSVAQLCEACYLLCQNCIGPTSSDCIGICKSISFVKQTSLGSTNKCECDTHYYYNSGLCYECHPLCLDCTGPSEVGQCISCGSDIRVVALGASPSLSCLCREHSYYNSSQKVCVECHPLCGNCTDDGPLKCTSFCTATILNANSTEISSGICSCNYHYYYNQSLKDCVICHHFCGDCIGEDPTQCTSVCNTNYTSMNKTAYNSEYECKCINQYFFDSSAPDCRECHPLCGDCVGYLNSECISSCHPTKLNIVASHPSITSTKCECDYHYFYNSSEGICDLCHPLCGDCSGSAETECLTECSQILSNVSTILGTTCSCIPHYYYNITLKICVKCHALCFDCVGDGNDQCSSCGSPKIVMNIPGLCECFSHYFYEPAREVCVECHPLCLECNNITNSNCLIGCNPQIKNLLDLNISTCECKDGYFYDGVNDCKNCHSYCKTCNGPTELDCLECSPGILQLILSNNSLLCLTTCFDDYYELSVVCHKCTLPCLSCIDNGTDYCLSCIDGFFMVKGSDGTRKCLTYCSQGYYASIPNRECISCDPSCVSCNGPSNNDCLECSNETLLIDGVCKENCTMVGKQVQCIDCKDVSCDICDKENCIICRAPYILFQNKCTLKCPPGSIAIKGQCQICHKTCKTCYGPLEINCIQCISGLENIKGKCLPIFCGDRRYYDTTQKTCKFCLDNCEKCINSSECKECSPLFILTQGKCLSCSDYRYGTFYNITLGACDGN